MDTTKADEISFPPYRQVAVVLLIALVMMGVSKLIPISEYSTTGAIRPWVVLCGLILFFAVCNSVLSLYTEDLNKYWMQSIISFVALLVVGGLLAWGISGVSISNAGSVKWLYFVFTFGYLVFLSIVNLLKFFVKLAQKQDKNLRGEE